MRGYNFSSETLHTLIKIHHIIENAGKLAREVEWLYSGDHGEESFNSIVDEIFDSN
jgi:hypothetical protein